MIHRTVRIHAGNGRVEIAHVVGTKLHQFKGRQLTVLRKTIKLALPLGLPIKIRITWIEPAEIMIAELIQLGI